MKINYLTSLPGKFCIFIILMMMCSNILAQVDPSDYYFRSKQSGNWNDTLTWEMSTNDSSWNNATFIPDYACKTITIQSTDTVTITASDTIDQVVVNGTLIYGDYSGSILYIYEGTDVDLTINGAFEDSGPNSVVWAMGSSWEFGNTGTLIRTRGTSSLNWHFRYHSGTSNMPATANWIVRKTGTEEPLLNGGFYFPNLYIENNTGTTWTTGINSSFTGTSYYRVKGDLHIGGEGSGDVSFTISNTYIRPVLITGDLVINSGSTLQNNGTGIEIRGDLEVNGSLTYGSINSRCLVFGGGNAQSISGSGTLGIYDMYMNKDANVLNLERSITVDHLVYLLNRNVSLGSYDLTLDTSAAIVAKTPGTDRLLELDLIGTWPDSSLTREQALWLDSIMYFPASGSSSDFVIINDVYLKLSPDINDEVSPSYVQTTGTGKLIKKLAADDIYVLLPVGDANFYTPYLLLINDSSQYGSDPEISVRVVNAAEPHTSGYNDYINRFWDVTLAGITELNAFAAYLYYDNDIEGNSGNLVPVRWTESDSLQRVGDLISMNFDASGYVNNASFNIVIDSNSAIKTGHYTVAGICDLTATISHNGDSVLCNGETDTLSVNSAPYYLWSNDSATQSIAINTGGDYAVYLSDDKGCTAVDKIFIYSSELSDPVSATDTAICSGNAVTLQANGGTSYYWSSGDTTATAEVSPDSAGVFYVTVTDEYGCVAYDSISVSVNPNPEADAGMGDTICAGVTDTLTASGGTAYLWSTSDTTASIAVSPAATQTYYVTVYNTYGCYDVDSVTITVNSLPDVSAGEDISLCTGMSDTLTASGGPPYLWSTSDTTASIVVTPDSTTVYFVSVTNGYGCTASDSVTVAVNEYAVAEAGADIEICQGKADTLTAGGGNAYLWSNSETTAQIIVAPDSTTTYWVSVSNNGCADVDSVTVTVHSLPTASAGTDTAICINDTAILTASGSGSFYWSTGDTTATITVYPTATTNYTVTVTNAQGCTATDMVTVTVHPLPNADAGFNQNIVLGDTATLVASGGSQYLWSTSDTSSTIFVSPTTATIYSLTVTDANGCVNTDDVTVLVGDTTSPYAENYWQKNDSVIATISGVSKVGIGTNNPTEKLCVAGNVKIDSLAGEGYQMDSLSAERYKLVFADESGRLVTKTNKGGTNCSPPTTTSWNLGGNYIPQGIYNFIGTCNKAPFMMFTHAQERMRIDPYGNIGIGTLYPKHILHINGNITLEGLNSTLLFGQNYPTTTANWGQWGIEYEEIAGGLNFWKPAGSNGFGNYLLFLKDNGNVGIGTSNPVAKLDITGNLRLTSLMGSSSRMMVVDANGFVSSQNFQILSINGNTLSISNGNSIIIPGDHLGNHTATQDIKLNGKWLSNVGGNGIKIGDNGRVGINVAPHLNNFIILSVGGDSYFQSAVGIGTPPTTGVVLKSNGNCELLGYAGIGGAYDATLTHKLKVNGGIGATGNIICNGNISTSSGKASIGGSINNGYTLYVYGSAWSTGTWGSSDIRYKKNIKLLEGSLEKIIKINGVQFEFDRKNFTNLSFDTCVNLGFIAQELREVLPEVVRCDENGFYSVNYDGIIPVIVEGIKEQQKMIEKNDNGQMDILYQMSKIKEDNDSLKNEIIQMKNKLNTIIDALQNCCHAELPNNRINSDTFEIIDDARLEQNNPNPFSKNTQINYYLPQSSGNAKIIVYDIRGRQILEFPSLQKGNGTVVINARELHAGIFIYTLIINGKDIDSKKMILTP